MKKVKILAVGIGGYGNIFIESYLKKQHPGCELVGVVDVYPQGCRYYQQLIDMGVSFYTDMDAFFTEKSADLTVITTPIHLHTRQILCALEHGSNVICEKPLSADAGDEKILCEARDKAGKFVSIGYQWSYSEAINALKRDIMAGRYGKPEFMKSIVLWPRTRSYFTRGIGWAGKLKADDGTPLNDSVVNNATAHYPHNIFYVLGGAVGKSAEVVDLRADLVRANDIENFDTATIRFTLDNGAEGIYVASHATLTANEPEFEYRFSGGIVSYDSVTGKVVGRLNTGKVIEYGDPFEDVTLKYWY
ncbi:MAG: Gfo/Idh/MocA family oxidoreductase, partial [Clostridia bacterium]|nr:Gfo/Idh/MocA family oxidoreductase [Clostridia bacterium]